MTRISSRMTFFQKRIFPAIWFSGLTLIISIAAVSAGVRREWAALAFLIVVALFMIDMGYLVMKALVFDLVDDVFDLGSELLVRNKGREERIAISDIMNVSYAGMPNSPRVVLQLRSHSAFGTEIAFAPRARMWPWSMPPNIKDLILRVDAARRLEYERERSTSDG